MTKQFPILPVEGDPDGIYYIVPDPSPNLEKKTRSLLATVGKRIGDLPLIEIPDTEDNMQEYDRLLNTAAELSEGICQPNNHVHDCDCAGWVAGYQYKAAQSKGTWSDEEVFNFVKYLTEVDPFGPYEYVDGKPEDLKSLIKSWHKEYAQKKVPTAVELEMEESGRVISGGLQPINQIGGKGLQAHISHKIKITNTETNTIIPVNVIYDNP